MPTLLISLAACTHGPVAADPAPFAACAAPAGSFEGDPDALYGGVDAELTGEVLDAGAGEPPDRCFDFLVVAPPTVEVDPAAAWWFQVADTSGAPWTVGVWLPDGPASPVVGDDVAVALSYRGGGFAPTIGQLEVRDGDGGLVAWIGAGGDLSDLVQPSEVHVDQGEIAGEDGGECGAWTSYDLVATAGAESVEVPYGEIAAVGGFEVRHGGYDLQRSSRGCPDWYVADVAVAFAPAR